MEEAFKAEGTACTNGENYESVLKGLERNVGLRLGGTLCARFRHIDFTPEVVWRQDRLLSLEDESGESMKDKLVWVAGKERVLPCER